MYLVMLCTLLSSLCSDSNTASSTLKKVLYAWKQLINITYKLTLISRVPAPWTSCLWYNQLTLTTIFSPSAPDLVLFSHIDTIFPKYGNWQSSLTLFLDINQNKERHFMKNSRMCSVHGIVINLMCLLDEVIIYIV